LTARIVWRLDKEGSLVTDTQLTTVEDLEDHIFGMPDDDLQEIKVDIHNFLDYWPRNSKQHRVDDLSHIFGVVRSPWIPALTVCTALDSSLLLSF
jgi:SET and MYND domain-containing protein